LCRQRKPGRAKLTHLVVLEARPLEPVNRGLEHRPLERLFSRHEITPPPRRFKGRTRLPRQAVDRHMLHPKRDGRSQIGLDAGQRLLRRGRHDVEIHDEPGIEQLARRRPYVAGRVVAVERLERRRIERLPPRLTRVTPRSRQAATNSAVTSSGFASTVTSACRVAIGSLVANSSNSLRSPSGPMREGVPPPRYSVAISSYADRTLSRAHWRFAGVRSQARRNSGQ